MATEELKSIAARVPGSLLTDFENLAKRNERSVSAELRRAMRAHLDSAKPREAVGQ